MSRIVAVLVVAILSACTITQPRNPAPIESLTGDYPPAIPNIPGARYWGDRAPPDIATYLAEIDAQRRAAGLNTNNISIALSGGGDDGAFGAGLMRGWTATGRRPQFATVTGVSTGALSAPFVFLGPDYDKTLQMLYGGLSPDAYYVERSLLTILPNASVSDSAPLFGLIEKYADEGMLAKVAAEHRRGRRLLIQSAHLDAQRPVIWDLGAIASSGAPNALEVFRKALLASASIPVAFPPVVFKVEVNGRIYDELHADGGVISEDTTLAGWAYDIRRTRDQRRSGLRPRTIYLVRNGRIDPEPSTTEYSLVGIAGRAVSTLIKEQGLSNILSAYETAKLFGADFRVTWIGRDFDHPYPAPFDPGYMKALQQYGYDLMLSGDAWESRPPMLMSDEERRRSPRLRKTASDGS